MKEITLYILLFLVSLGINAQGSGPEKRDGDHPQRQEFSPQLYKKALEDFVTKDAELTCEEAEKLFPLVHKMMHDQRKVKEQQRELFKQSFSKDLSESDYERIVNKSLTLEIENQKIEQKYFNKFHSILTWKKVFLVRRALAKFQMEALKRIAPPNKRRGGGEGPGPKK